ncbi:MAG: GAF domain-containing protein [Bacteroidetes bacterium]|nr:MAG: GAF domain-containing protein [Bacteroidota bacterium]REK64897.1 MAG: GAF domain-containing protein [Bacteroidota bacterium]
MKQEISQRLIKDLENFDTISGIELQKSLVQWLDEEVSYYNWTGFYFMNNAKQQLEIGPYVGAYTDHTVIPYGRGICGQVAVSGKTFEVPDVHAQDNYLACSLATKSEIVVPIYKGENLVGQIDIDSHELDPFTQEDHDLLEAVANFVAQRL